MNTTPVSLLQRVCRNTDPNAWTEFVDLLLPLLWKWVGRLKLAEQDAADLIQDVFVVLLKELPGFQYNPARSFRAWLWTILKRRATDQFRRVRPQQLEPEFAVAVLEVPLIEEAEYRELLLSRVLKLVQVEFSADMWRAFWEHCINGRPVDEVAAKLSISPGTVYVAKGRVLKVARDRLKDLLD